MNLDEFQKKVDSDLVGKVVNLASRTARFVEETGLSKSYPDDGGLFKASAAAGEEIAAAYEACDYSKAMRVIMQLADTANEYVATQQPWKLRKEAGKEQLVQDVCTVTLNLYRQIIVYLTPVLPRLSQQTVELLNSPIQHWNDSQSPLIGSSVCRRSKRYSIGLIPQRYKP